MSLTLFKTLSMSAGGIAAVSGASYGIYYLSRNDLSQQTLNPGTDSTTTADAIVISETFTLDDDSIKTTQLLTQERNYTCKLSTPENKEDGKCVVKLINLLNEKKQLNLTEIKSINGTDPTIQQLNANNNYFKVSLKTDIYSSILWDQGSTKIDIYSQGDKNIKIGSLKPIFGINGDVIEGKTVYSVGKVSKFLNNATEQTPSGDVIIQSTGSKCFFITSDTNGIPCSINKFVETVSGAQTNFSELSFNGSVVAETNIKKDAYYLFKFDTESNAKKKSDFKSDPKAEVTLTPPVNGVSAQNIDKLEISDLTPVILIGAEKSQAALLLGDISATSSS